MAARLGLSPGLRLGQESSSQPPSGLAPSVPGVGTLRSRPEERGQTVGVLDLGMAMGTRNPMGKNPIRARVWRILIPMGILLGHSLCPSGTVGVDMFFVAPYPLPNREPVNI
jgi:hypothetical protein